MIDINLIREVLGRFVIHGNYVTHCPHGNGHINDTIKVEMNQSGTKVPYLLQRINTRIFQKPVQLMENIQRVTEFQGLQSACSEDGSRRNLTLLRSRDGKNHVVDSHGGFWRAYLFIAGARTFDVVETPRQAHEAANAFGRFQKVLTSLPGEPLHDTIPRFHDTRWRLENLRKACRSDVAGRLSEVNAEVDAVLARAALVELYCSQDYPRRVVHNDTKLNNVMIDEITGEGLCVIDLDTVMSGNMLYDFGDLVRSSTSPAKEDEKDLSLVSMRPAMFQALASGYAEATRDFISPVELEYLPFAGLVSTLEVAARFLTDHLEGDVYFKIKYNGHNLDRCRNQLRLVASIEGQLDAIRAILRGEFSVPTDGAGALPSGGLGRNS